MNRDIPKCLHELQGHHPRFCLQDQVHTSQWIGTSIVSKATKIRTTGLKAFNPGIEPRICTSSWSCSESRLHENPNVQVFCQVHKHLMVISNMSPKEHRHLHMELPLAHILREHQSTQSLTDWRIRGQPLIEGNYLSVVTG